MIEPGLYNNITNEEYHAGPGLSSSDLKRLAKSPEHYKYQKIEETDAMKLGSAVHCAVFEPERFEAEYGLYPEGDGRKTEIKEARQAFDASGKIGLTASEMAKACAIRKSILQRKLAKNLITGGIAEQSVYWKQAISLENNKELEILCKCRPDYRITFDDGSYVIIDLKTTRDPRQSKFERAAWYDYGYHISAAHYWNGLSSILGRHPSDFIFIAAETEPPYGIITYRATPKFISRGMEECYQLYKTYAECKLSNNWPGYPEVFLDLDVPKYA